MDRPAQSHKVQVLITDVSSYPGSKLASSLLSQNCEVFGIGKSPPLEEILHDHDFTLLDINLAQPFPSHLPQFDIILHFIKEDIDSNNIFFQRQSLSASTINIISQATQKKSKVYILAPISASSQFYEYIAKDESTKKFLKLLLIGDVYGPGLNFDTNQKCFSKDNELADLIFQAVSSDKVILEKEGLKMIYPTYITDAIFAINKFVFGHSPKNVHFIISEPPKTSLSVAYVIQNIASLTLNKELNLFFSGPQTQIKPEPEPVIRIPDLGYAPQIELAEGLTKTFEYLNKLDSTPIQATGITNQKPEFRHEAKVNQLVTKHDTLDISQNLRKTVNLTLPLPKLSSLRSDHKLRNLVLLVFIFLILTTAKTGIDFYLGISKIKSAQSAVLKGDFANANKKAKQSASSFRAASSEVKVLAYPISFISPQKYQSINLTFESLTQAANSLSYLIQGSEVLMRDLKIISSKDSKKEGFDLETPSANFKKAYFHSSQAYELARQARKGGIFTSKMEKVEDNIKNLNQLSSSYEFTNLINALTGSGKKKTYLILLQNNTELRPGGGFIGNFGLIQFEDGRLKNISVEDIYTIDGQLKEKIDPPKELTEKLGVKNLYLRDSNWSPDFELNSSTAKDFYKKETGQEVDGVIAVDLSLIQQILSKIGPVKLNDFNEEITAQNLFERGEYYSEVGFFPGSTQKKDFFGGLTRNLIDKTLESLSHANSDGNSQKYKLPWLDLVNITKENLAQKHLMLSFADPSLSTFFKAKGWDNPLYPLNFNPADDSTETRDFLTISEANLGANKVNRFIDRNIDYEMTIGKDADLVAKLTITYKNNSQAETWPGGTYVNYLRVYTPFAASLFEFQNGDKSDLKNVGITNSDNLTTLATFVEVPPKQTKKITFTYRIPKNIKLEQTPTYHLYISKQPGTEKDPFNFTFNLPGYLKVKSIKNFDGYSGRQNFTLSSNLSTDRQFQIELTKN